MAALKVEIYINGKPIEDFEQKELEESKTYSESDGSHRLHTSYRRKKELRTCREKVIAGAGRKLDKYQRRQKHKPKLKKNKISSGSRAHKENWTSTCGGERLRRVTAL